MLTSRTRTTSCSIDGSAYCPAQVVCFTRNHLCRRSRSDLFKRVRNRVDSHKMYLHDRNQTLIDKLNAVTNKCLSLIEELTATSLSMRVLFRSCRYKTLIDKL